MKTITVKELIDLLSDQDPDALVIFTTAYGDRCNTQQALPIRGIIEDTEIEETAYSTSGFAIKDDDDDDRSEDDTYEPYLVIR